MTDSAGSDGPNPHQAFREHLNERMMAERRIGKHPGAGPEGSRMLSKEELPDDPSALKAMYMEQQRTLRDAHAQHENEKEKLRWGGEETLDDVLSHIWTRGLEFGGVLAALSFIAVVFAPTQLTSMQLTLGVFAVAAFWERYIREFAHKLGGTVLGKLD